LEHIQQTSRDRGRDLQEAYVRRIRNQYWNAFKHATKRNGSDREDDDVFTAFSDEKNDHVLYLGWIDYFRATRSIPLEAQVFQVWYYAMYPEKLRAPSDALPGVQKFGDLKSVSRCEAKRRLRIVIEDTRSDKALMDHPETDNRPLLAARESHAARANLI
jgi:hypothetical protein